MEWLIVLVLIAGVAYFVLLKQQGGSTQSTPLYKMRKQFLSPAERSFYGVLEQAVLNDFRVHTKVRVADVLQPDSGGDRSKWQRAFNKISSKHFDYVLCDPDTLDVKAAVELNDKSHTKKKVQSRDEFLAEACSAAGLTLVSFDAKAQYSIAEVREKLTGP